MSRMRLGSRRLYTSAHERNSTAPPNAASALSRIAAGIPGTSPLIDASSPAVPRATHPSAIAWRRAYDSRGVKRRHSSAKDTMVAMSTMRMVRS